MRASEVRTKDVMKWAKNELRRQNVMVPDYPEDQTTIDEAELSEYMQQFSHMYSWCTRLLGVTEAELKLIEAEVNLFIDSRKPTVKVNGEGRITKEVAYALVLEQNEEIGEAYQNMQRLIALQTMLEAACRACDKSTQALSRDLTRREIEIKKRVI